MESVWECSQSHWCRTRCSLHSWWNSPCKGVVSRGQATNHGRLSLPLNPNAESTGSLPPAAKIWWRGNMKDWQTELSSFLLRILLRRLWNTPMSWEFPELKEFYSCSVLMAVHGRTIYCVLCTVQPSTSDLPQYTSSFFSVLNFHSIYILSFHIFYKILGNSCILVHSYTPFNLLALEFYI